MTARHLGARSFDAVAASDRGPFGRSAHRTPADRSDRATRPGPARRPDPSRCAHARSLPRSLPARFSGIFFHKFAAVEIRHATISPNKWPRSAWRCYRPGRGPASAPSWAAGWANGGQASRPPFLPILGRNYLITGVARGDLRKIIQTRADPAHLRGQNPLF
jgi:hypothetical protein